MTAWTPDIPDRLVAQIFVLRMEAYRALGWKYQSPGAMPPALPALRSFGMIYSGSGRFVSRGSVTGKGYDEQVFSLSDVTAPPRIDLGYAGFGGIILSLSLPMVSSSRTIVCGDKGPLNPTIIEDMKRIGFVDAAFEKRFEVFGDDQVISRSHVTPDFMERLMQFDQDYLGRNIQCAFLGNQFHICLEIDDRFDFNTVPHFECFEDARAIILMELASVFTVLELGQRLQVQKGVQTEETLPRHRREFYAKELEKVITAFSTKPDDWDDWDDGPQIDPDMKYSHFLFDGYLGQMIKPIYRPLSSKYKQANP